MSIDGRTKFGAPVALVLAGIAAGCGSDAAAGAPEADASGSQEAARVINVEVMPVERTTFTDLIRLTGTVQANQDVMVSAEEGGVIRRIFVDKGTVVRPGQALAKIDDRVLLAQVKQVRAQAALARETWERRKRLWEEDQVGSEIAYLEARYGAEEAEANLERLTEQLARTTVRAPIGGVLDDRMVEVGTMVSPGTPAFRIVELDPVKITGGVPERFAPDVAPGDSVRVTFDVLVDEVYGGAISFVGAAVNPRNRTFPVEFRMDNPGRVIKPEMVANIEIVRETRPGALVIPREALVRVEDGQVAFVVAGDGGREVARARRVVLGPAQRNRVVIEAGLEPGDRLIVVGQQQVAAGDRVRIVARNPSGVELREGSADSAVAEAPREEGEGSGR